ncbi:putative cytochrome P450 28d1 isoform 1-T1 [Glossina fuscipes fuscipes]
MRVSKSENETFQSLLSCIDKRRKNMITLLILVLIIVLIVLLLYYYLMWNIDYWPKRNVNGPKPQIFYGTFPNLLKRQQHMADDMKDIYQLYKARENFVGVYLLRAPQLMILNPQIIHDILVNDFKHFEDNDVGKLINRDKDPLIAQNPFILMGDEWRQQRSLLSPALTNSKLKVAYHIMQNICEDLIHFVNENDSLHHSGPLNGKDLALRFTAESLSDCILGIKANSFSRSSALPITENVRKFAENNTAFIVFSIMVGLFPKILSFYKAKFFPHDCETFFMDLMSKAYNLRIQDNTNRPDILNYLLEIKNLYKLPEVNMYSHIMTFLIDGLDTTATVIAHCLLMLAFETECQDKLYKEIMEAATENGKLSFEKLNSLPYLDACIHECLRIYPPGLWATKCCTKAYKISNKNGSCLHIRKGETILIPIYGIHHDSHYYAEPEKFRPERFLMRQNSVRYYKNKGQYLGFGDGPRICLGMNFALMQCKGAVSALIRNFNVKANTKTKSSYKLDAKCFLASHHGGVWLNFQKR